MLNFRYSTYLLPVLLLLAVACSAHRLVDSAPGIDGGDTSDGPPPLMNEAPDGLATRPPSSVEQCAEEAIRGETFPLDLLLVLDASGSMNFKVADKTRWQLVSDALGRFVSDPRSSGLGVGFQSFPFTSHDKACTSDADCNGAPQDCSRPFLCVGLGVLPAVARICNPSAPYCPEANTECVPSGRCTGSSARCVNLGQLCPGGGPNDFCDEAPLVCRVPIDSCAVGDYEQPKVPIAVLPESARAITAGLRAVMPTGNTPIAPAIEGATRYVRQRLAADPERRAALVLASDASPTGCGRDTIETVLTALEAARDGFPSLPTYVIGAVSPGDLIGERDARRLARAGGSNAPFILNDSSPDLDDRFLEALTAIRKDALPCAFGIPRPSTGMIDYGKVNVRYVGPGGSDDLIYVRGEDGCDPSGGGWYYDVDPAASAPSSVQVCSATCARFKSEPDGVVELRFGCRTRLE
jgi:hypothetical protein